LLCVDKIALRKMSSEEDVSKAGKLVQGWKEQVSASFPEGSVLRTQLQQSLSDATERVAKVGV
jgi:hypothetical protein